MLNRTLTTIYLAAVGRLELASARLTPLFGSRDERGQASAEYALVLLGAALLAIALGGWLTKNDTLNKVFGDLLDTILGKMPK